MLGRFSPLIIAGVAIGLLGSGPTAPADGQPGPSDGRPAGRMAERAAAVAIAVGHSDLPVGRWSWVRVRVRLAEPADELSVSGRCDRPEDLRTRSVSRHDVDAGRIVIRMPAKLMANHERRLLVRALVVAEQSATGMRSVRVRPLD